jgi:nitrogen fixation/metabolism regulation signal transduction histidine kinase
MNSTTQRQSHALFESALITFAMVVVSAMIGLWTSRTVTTPVLKLTEAIQELEKGHLETRVNEDFGGEIGTLQHGFNTMATALQQAHDEFRMWNWIWREKRRLRRARSNPNSWPICHMKFAHPSMEFWDLPTF